MDQKSLDMALDIAWNQVDLQKSGKIKLIRFLDLVNAVETVLGNPLLDARTMESGSQFISQHPHIEITKSDFKPFFDRLFGVEFDSFAEKRASFPLDGFRRPTDILSTSTPLIGRKTDRVAPPSPLLRMPGLRGRTSRDTGISENIPLRPILGEKNSNLDSSIQTDQKRLIDSLLKNLAEKDQLIASYEEQLHNYKTQLHVLTSEVLRKGSKTSEHSVQMDKLNQLTKVIKIQDSYIQKLQKRVKNGSYNVNSDSNWLRIPSFGGNWMKIARLVPWDSRIVYFPVVFLVVLVIIWGISMVIWFRHSTWYLQIGWIERIVLWVEDYRDWRSNEQLLEHLG